MRDFFRSLSENQQLKNARRWINDKTAPIMALWAQVTAPIMALWAQVTAPVRTFLTPVTDAWGRMTYPLRLRWAAFRQRFPIAGNVAEWAGKLVKWGFYLLLFLIFGVWIGLFGEMPSTDELKSIENANATEIYSADSVLIGKYYIENRTEVSLENISPHIINALIATEDRRFLDHSGIDIQSWFRVAFGMLTRQDHKGGGSTLPQQLAKNLYPRKKYKVPGVSLVINKIRENIISMRLEQIYSKPQLLSLYLNTVPFGGDLFGISVASKQYFSKKPKDLTVDQAATLVGMLKGPSIYHPIKHQDNAKSRRNVVLGQMVKNGNLTQKEYDELSKKPVGAKKNFTDSNNGGLGTYFREYLRTEIMPKLLKNVQKEDGSNYNLYTDGLKIYTSVHSKMQQYAEEAVEKQMAELQVLFNKHWKNYKDKPWGDDQWIDDQIDRSARWDALLDAGVSEEDALKNFEQPVKMTVFAWKNGSASEIDTVMSPIDSVRYYFCLLNCSFLAMDHRNGLVRAWVGGTNFKYFKFDHILSKRQVGSTFKPIVYAAALQDSVRPCDYFPNQIKKIVDWEPHNSDEEYGGYYSLSGALARSVNVVAAQLIEKVGISKTIDLATKMGVTSKLPREYGISLGAADIALYDMIKVYGTIANQGVRPEPTVLLNVTDRNGRVLFDYKTELAKNTDLGPHERALSVNQAATMTKLMQNVIDYGTGSRLRRGYGITGDFAGKTGTTQNQSDGWFICFNPQLVTGAWVGAESPAVRFRSLSLGQGSAMALPIVGWFWHKMANDPKFGKMLTERFPEAKPEVMALFGGCHPWLAISPDSLSYLIHKDSTKRDSLIRYFTTRQDDDASEAPAVKLLPGDKNAKPGSDKEPAKDKPNVFQKIFGYKPDDQHNKDKSKEKEKDKGKKQ
jgi:penicillin-binding protein 1A